MKTWVLHFQSEKLIFFVELEIFQIHLVTEFFLLLADLNAEIPYFNRYFRDS